MLNQALSFQTPQPYYTIQVPQVSLQYTGYPSKSIQDQLNVYGNPKPTVPIQTTQEKIICQQTQKAPEKARSVSNSKNKKSNKSLQKNSSKISLGKTGLKLSSQKSIGKSQLNKSVDKKKNSSKDA